VPCLRTRKLKIPDDLDKMSYNKLDDKVNVVMSNLTIDTNARYWETSLIDTVTQFAKNKYGDLVDLESEFITVQERHLRLATHNTWKEQASNVVIMRDKGDEKSIVAVGKVKLKNVFVNDYTAFYFLLKYKFAIKLVNDETEELIMNLAYSLLIPDFLNGKYQDCSFAKVMVMGPNKTIDQESLWTSEYMRGVGKENPVLKVRFFISGDIKFKQIKSQKYDKGIDQKIKSIYTELDQDQEQLEEMRRTQELKFTRTMDMKDQLQKEFEMLTVSRDSLQNKKQDLEMRLSKVKRLLNEDESLLKEEYGSKESKIKEDILKLEQEVKDYRNI